MGRYRDPYVSIPRPLNRFMDVTEGQLDKKEKEQDDLARILKEQMEEKKRRTEEEKKRKQLED